MNEAIIAQEIQGTILNVESVEIDHFRVICIFPILIKLKFNGEIKS